MKLKDLLNEISIAGGSGTFTGAPGDFIDTKLAGPFNPDKNDLKKQLDKQVKDDIEKRMYSDDKTPHLDPDFIDLGYDYEYDTVLKIDASKFKSDSDTEMQFVGIDINYDKIIDKTEENKKFINSTNDWKSIYDSKKY